MFDPKFFALLAAIMETLVKERPEIRGEILKLADRYEKEVFLPDTIAYLGMQSALWRILNGS